MGNGVVLKSRTSFREIGAIVGMLWMWTIMVLAAGFVLGNTVRDNLSLAGIFCQEK